MTSIDPNLIAKGCCLSEYLIKEDLELKLDEVRENLHYIKGEEGSNESIEIDDAIVEFELFLAGLDSNRFEGLSLRSFLVFAIGMDRIPVFGLEKKIDIEFVNVDRLPKTSTCGLMMEIPRNKTQERCEYALRHCKTYGIA